MADRTTIDRQHAPPDDRSLRERPDFERASATVEKFQREYGRVEPQSMIPRPGYDQWFRQDREEVWRQR